MKQQVGRARFATLVIGVALGCGVGLAGCGPAQEPMFPVEGKIQVDGKPLAKGSVVLHPDAAKNNTTKHDPRGSVIEGKYKVATHPRDGAPPGWYKVTVISTEPSDPKNPYSEPRHLIPEKYGKADGAPVSIEVRKDAPAGAYDLDFK